MEGRGQPTFQQVLCSSPELRCAFAQTRYAWWWRILLWLHGKPIEIDLSEQQRVRRVAEGFRFYAWLYRALAVTFTAVSLALWWLIAVTPNAHFDYWAIGSFVAGGYLWLAAGLCSRGAEAYLCSRRVGRVWLLAFLVMVVGFLSLFAGAISLFIHDHNSASTIPNLLATGALLAFGVGSYFIEIVYLAGEASGEADGTGRKTAGGISAGVPPAADGGELSG